MDVTEYAEWFTKARFGLFLHWGLYSVGARHEWMQFREQVHPDEYAARYREFFDPDLYDPVQWAEQAWRAGMRYAVLTTKHHEGFCLWDTDLTDFKADRDLVAEYVNAFRARGLRIGFYHSLLDWHHPSFPVDTQHPMRDDAGYRAVPRNMGEYTDYLHGQVRELLSRYGQIDVMWFDYSYADLPEGKGAKDWRSTELLAMVRELQPGILVNNRLELAGDFVTPEQFQPATAPDQPWEACHTLNGSWGYDRDNHQWKSVDLLIRMLVDCVSKDGNLLLNVGPNARGEFQPEAVSRLDGVGQWMRLHARSIHGAGASVFTPPPDCRYTQRDDRLYVHLFAWPQENLHLPGLAGRVRHAQFLHDGSEVRHAEPVHGNLDPTSGLAAETLTLRLPALRPDVAVPVIELFLR